MDISQHNIDWIFIKVIFHNSIIFCLLLFFKYSQKDSKRNFYNKHKHIQNNSIDIFLFDFSFHNVMFLSSSHFSFYKIGV